MPDLKIDKKFMQKRCVRASVAELNYADINTAESYELFNLPENCTISFAQLRVINAGDATFTADVGFSGGSEIVTAGALDSTGYVAGTSPLHTGTGKTVTILPSGVLTQGDFEVIVEYIEHDTTTGEYTTI